MSIRRWICPDLERYGDWYDDDNGPCVWFTDHEADKATAITEATAALQSRLEAAERVVELAKMAKERDTAMQIAERKMAHHHCLETQGDFFAAQAKSDEANAALFGALP